MITGLDHIALAVGDLQAAIQRLSQDFGIPMTGQEDVPSQSTSTAFFPISGTRIELVHPIDGQGPIAGYLAKRGEGMHHLCFTTDDIEADVARLKDKGYRFLGEIGPGAHGTRVIFIHPKSAGGVLVELAEHPKDHS